jgi:hypothetical protein
MIKEQHHHQVFHSLLTFRDTFAFRETSFIHSTFFITRLDDSAYCSYSGLVRRASSPEDQEWILISQEKQNEVKLNHKKKKRLSCGKRGKESEKRMMKNVSMIQGHWFFDQ